MSLKRGMSRSKKRMRQDEVRPVARIAPAPTKCDKECEVYSRIVGYFRPVQRWNIGKKEEFKDRLEYDEEKTLGHEFSRSSKNEEKPEED